MNYITVEDQPNQAAAKAILVLEAFTGSRPEWGVRELARELGMNPTTIHRLVSTLQNAGYLEQNSTNQRYVLGPRVMRLAEVYAHQNPLPALARRVFETFAHRFEYNFYLGTLSTRYEMVYLAVLDGRGPIKIAVEPGGTIKLHSTALGKVLLAFQGDDYVLELLGRGPLKAYTPRTITDPQELWSQIHQIRERGYALNDGEHYDEVAAVAVPLYGRDGSVQMSVSLAYPRQLVRDHENQVRILLPLAREVAAEITRRLQGMAPGGR